MGKWRYRCEDGVDAGIPMKTVSLCYREVIFHSFWCACWYLAAVGVSQWAALVGAPCEGRRRDLVMIFALSKMSYFP